MDKANFQEFLYTLPENVFDELYEDVWTVQAVFRCLPKMTQMIFMEILFALPSNISRDAILGMFEHLCRDSGVRNKSERELERLKIIRGQEVSTLFLNKLRTALLMEATYPFEELPEASDPSPVTPETLSEFCNRAHTRV